MEPADDPHRVGRSVEEIRIAECDVFGACGDLCGDVLEHRVGVHDREPTSIHGDDRAVAAHVLAAARRLGVSGHPGGPGAGVEPGVLVEGGEAGSQRGTKLDPFDGGEVVSRTRCMEGFHKSGFELSGDHGVGAEFDQSIEVHVGVQTETDDTGTCVEFAAAKNDLFSKAGRGVHRYRDPDEVRGANRFGLELADRKVLHGDVGPGIGEPARRGGDTEGLSPEFVRGDEDGAHVRRIFAPARP